MRDLFADAHDGIRLAVRDHEGAGPALVLLHGAGSHLLSLGYLVRQLRGHRVVTMDARWSGWSGDSPAYDWNDLVQDVEAVVAALALDTPVVAGHSWGGMIAAYYGVAHPEARAVINIDGHGQGHPSLYDGMTEADATAALEEITAISDDMVMSMGPREGDDAWQADQRAAVVAGALASGLKPELAEEYADRGFVRTGEGRWALRPAPTLMEGLRGDLRLFDVYRRVECPLLIFNCSLDQPGLPPVAVEPMRAYRRGLSRVLRELAAEKANVEVAELPDVDHQGVAGRGAPAVAAVIEEFLAGR